MNELLISNAEKAHNVASRLRQINHDFDFLMSICSFIQEDETMHGRMSHKIDMIKRKNVYNQRVEELLANIQVPAHENELESSKQLRRCD